MREDLDTAIFGIDTSLTLPEAKGIATMDVEGSILEMEFIDTTTLEWPIPEWSIER